jgi:hypothetical protein
VALAAVVAVAGAGVAAEVATVAGVAAATEALRQQPCDVRHHSDAAGM